MEYGTLNISHAVPAFNGAIQGPYAVYRGPVPHRMLPPSPNNTLPHIQQGQWACARTSPHGFFQERPYCLAVCDDPSHIAVDVGLERGDGGSRETPRTGWALVASQARQWYSYWLGYPGLVQDKRLYGNDRLAQVPALGSVRPVRASVSPPSYEASTPNGPSRATDMRCMPDDDAVWSRSWSWESHWVQRLPAARAEVTLDIVFDRNTYPAAFTQIG